MRIKFRKGEQRKFLDLVLERVGSPSLRELINRGIEVKKSTLKNYYIERRALPKELFNVFCEIADLKESDFEFEKLDDNWGQKKGGKTSRKSGPTRN